MIRKKVTFSQEHHDEILINLTPLIDVVFVVLVAFILIAPLLEVDRIDLAAGSDSSLKEISQKSHIVIYVREDDSIWWDHRPISKKELASMLKEARQKYPTQIPQVYQDKKATFGQYQEIKNAIESAGFEGMDVVLKPR